jgi:acetyltransferase
MVLVAVWASGTGDEIVAVGRLSKFHGNNDAEFAILIRDDFQRRGLGTRLLSKLLEIARIEIIDHVVGFILAGNSAMQKIADRLDFTLDFTSDPDLVIATKAMV